LTKLWNIAQVLPPRPRFVQQLETVCNWFIWQGAVFRVPASTLHQSKTKGGWGLLHIAAKCRTLLLYRMWILSRKAGTITAARMQRWRLMDTEENPPHRNKILGELHYLRLYVNDMAYISPPERRESISAFKKRMYEVLCAMDTVAKGEQSMRVIRKYPLTPWERVWHNLHNAPIPVRLKSVWYIAIHELILTNERLAHLRLAESEICSQFGRSDTLAHWLLDDCGTGRIIWTWTRTLNASWLRYDPQWVTEEWAVRPCFQLWPPQKHAAVAWLLAHLVDYRQQ
jgi:hypothetical protein